jgi:tetratricopeptide (TPR) repeat protein
MHNKSPHQPISVASTSLFSLENVQLAIVTLLVFLIPLVPDIRLSRPKLLLIETSLYGLIFFWALSGCIARKFILRLSDLLFPVLLYVAFMVSYTLFSPERSVTANELQRILLSLFAFVLTVQIVNNKTRRYIFISAWLAGAALAVTYGILQHYGGIGRLQVPLMARITSTFGNPIFFAAFVLATIPLAFGFLLAVRSGFGRFILLLFVAASIYAVYLTGTRAALIGLLAAALLFAALALSPRWKYIVIAAFILGTAVFAGQHMDLIHRQQAHLLIWRDTLVLWLQHPVLGTGPGTFHLNFPRVASEELLRVWPKGQTIVNDAHNEYLQTLAETGIIGMGIFAALLFLFFARTRSVLRSSEIDRDRYIFIGIIASAAALLVQNFFSVDMRFTVSTVLLFLLLGLADTFGNGSVRQFSFPLPLRGMAALGIILTAAYVFPVVLAPYTAQRKIAAAPDFFDEKVLEPLKTVRELEGLAQQYPDQAALFEKLGWVYAKEKNWGKAITNLQRAIQLDPQRAGPLNNLGNIYYLIGDRKNAIACWQRSLKIDPRQPDSRLNLATAFYYEGNLKEAAEQLKEILKTDPGNMKALVLLKDMSE